MKIERTGLVWVILFSIIIFFTLAESAELEQISEKEKVSGRIGEGRSYFLRARESQLLTVQLETSSTNNVAQLIVLNSDLNFVGLIQTPGRARSRGSCEVDEPKVTQALCSNGGTERGYYFNITGTSGAKFSFSVDDENENRLKEDKLKDGRVKERSVEADDVQYFFFDVDVDNDKRPFEVRLKSDDSVKALLSASYEDCPLESFDDRYQQNTTAYLTFTRQATLIVSRYSNPKMQRGRWIFRVEALDSCRRKKKFTIDPSYGFKYEDYFLPVFILLFVIPVAALIIFAFFFILFYILSKGIESQGEALDPIYRRQEAWWFTLMAFLLFFIIGIQFTVRELRYMDMSGDYDRCFYNERCKRPLGFQAFNNMWSNLAYVIVGFELLIYFYLAKLLFKSAVPRDFSVMFAIAIAIIAQGVLSTTYHVCPTRTNFQLDTNFMFVIGALVMYELYRKSFKKVFNAGYVFVALAILILLNYIGSLLDTADNHDAHMVNEGSKGYRLMVYFCFFIPLLLIAIRCVYFHEKSFKEIFTDFGAPAHWGRILLLFAIWVAVTVITYALEDNAEMFLFCIVAATIICLVLFFFKNVWKHRSTSGIIPLGIGWFLLLTLGLLFWAAALAMFGMPWANKSASPAASRNENRGCVIMDFYDTHDLWHILGAMGLGLIAVLIAHYDPDENNNAERQKLDFQKNDKYSQASQTKV